MRKEQALLWVEIATLFAYVWYVYDNSIGLPSSVEFNYGVSNFCYRAASWFGRRGMRAERRYHELVDAERTV